MLNNIFNLSEFTRKNIEEKEYEKLSDVITLEETTKNKIENKIERVKKMKKNMIIRNTD